MSEFTDALKQLKIAPTVGKFLSLSHDAEYLLAWEHALNYYIRNPGNKSAQTARNFILEKADHNDDKQKKIDTTLMNLADTARAKSDWTAVLNYLAQHPKDRPSQEAMEFMLAVSDNQLEEAFKTYCNYQKQDPKATWKPVLDFLIQNQDFKPSQGIIHHVLKIAASYNRWEDLKVLCDILRPDPKTTGELLQLVAGNGSLEGVRLLLKGKPNQYYVKNAFHIAKNAGHSQMAVYLSYELIRIDLKADPLLLTQAILQNYVKQTSIVSSLFNGQIKAVKDVLLQIKRTAKQEYNEDAQNETVIEAVTSLKKIMGSNQHLIACVDYIHDFAPKSSTIKTTPAMEI